jgi:septum formation protein
MHLVLASGSPRRKQLFAEAGYRFDVIVPSAEAECGACSNTGPIGLVTELALRKAADVIDRLRIESPERRGIVVSADTVAECQGQILGKPRDEAHARQMLRLLSGREHRVYTGVCVWPFPAQADDSAAYQLEVDTTTLRMDPLSEGLIESYLAGGQWQGKAGAFGYQDGLDWVHILEGSESNVVGLPMERLRQMLGRVGS